MGRARISPEEDASSVLILSGKNEYTETLAIGAFYFRHFSGDGVFVSGKSQTVFAGYFFHDCMGQNGDSLVVSCLIRHRYGTGKIVLPDENRYIAGEFGKKHTFFRRGIAASHHIGILSGKEFAVAGSGAGNTPLRVRILSDTASAGIHKSFLHKGIGTGGGTAP